MEQLRTEGHVSRATLIEDGSTVVGEEGDLQLSSSGLYLHGLWRDGEEFSFFP